MRPDNVELAGGNTLEAIQASRRSVLERAPAWWRAAAEAGERGNETSSRPAARVRRMDCGDVLSWRVAGEL